MAGLKGDAPLGGVGEHPFDVREGGGDLASEGEPAVTGVAETAAGEGKGEERKRRGRRR